MSLWGQITWDLARAGGFTAYGLLTLSVVLGLALALRWQSPRWPRLINSELHNFVTLLSLIFTSLHILAVWLDPFTAFGWTEIFIPFVSHYRPLWVAFGIVAFYLGLALAASVWLRPRMGYEWWRKLHVLTLLVFALVTVHGITTGSDTQAPWAVLVYVVCGGSVAALLALRLLWPASPHQTRHPVWASMIGVALVAGIVLAIIGPMRAGWNAIANNGNGSGQRAVIGLNANQANATATPATTPTAPIQPIAPPFQAQATGTLREQGPDARGQTTVTVTATLSGGAQGVMELQIVGTKAQDGALYVASTQALLGPSWSAPTYQGTLTRLQSTGSDWTLEGLLRPVSGSGSAMDLHVNLTINSDNSVTGTVQGTVATGHNGDDDGSGGDTR
jgi:hypothetical protein